MFRRVAVVPIPSVDLSGALRMIVPSIDSPMSERLLAEIEVRATSPKSYVPFGRNILSPSLADLSTSMRLDASPEEMM